MTRVVAVVACLLVLTVAAVAEPIAKGEAVTIKAKIDAIDHSSRTLVLRDKDGRTETLSVGPEVKRFDELKVGDQVTFRYSESVVMDVRKPGEPAAAPRGIAVVQRGSGPKPSGTVSAQETATVLIRSIDPKIPSMTVETADGRTLSFKIEDKGLVGAFKPGDRVEITFTVALAVDVT